MNASAVETVRKRERMPRNLAVITMFLVSAGVLALKAPDALTMPQFWAEDGVIFFLAQHGVALPKLFEPYAGYLHFLPRLVAWVASGFSAAHAPLIYNLGALLLGAAALTSLRRLDRLGVGFLLAIAPILLAPTNGEVWGTITNLQWLTQFYLVSALARLLQDEDDSIPLLRVLLAVAVGLTGPFVIFAVAAALLGSLWLWRFDRIPRPPLRRTAAPISAEWMVLGACAGIQLLTIANAAGASASETPSLHAYLIFAKSVQLHLFGAQLMPTWLFFASLAGMAAFALAKSTVRQQALMVAIGIFIALQMLAAARKCADNPEQLLSFGFGDRYFLLFKVAFWWLVAIAVVRALPRSRHLVRVGVAVLLGCNALAMPSAWRRQAYADLHWTDYAERIDAGEAVDVPINPIPWQIHVPERRQIP